MKFSKKIGYFAVVFLSFTIIGCSNPGNTPVIPIQTGTNGANPTTPANPESPTTPTTPAQPESPATPTNPETPATTQPENPTTPTTPETPNTPTGGETTTTSPANPESPEPQYKWLLTHWENESQSNSSSYTSTSNSTMNYAYSFYNSDFDYGITTIYELNMNVTSNGNTTNTSSNTKTVSTCSQTGNNITIHSNNYTMNGSSWVLSSESSSVYFKYTQLLSSNNTRTYPAGTETTTNYTVELLDNSNGVERYKVTYPAEYGIYCVYEFANNRIQKQVYYNSATNKKDSETDYTYSDNSILVENNIELALTNSKTYDNNEQIISQLNTTLENVTLNANNTITVILGNSTNTSTNYSYTTEIFTKMQIPFSQQ